MECDRCKKEFKKLFCNGTKLVCEECKEILTYRKRRKWQPVMLTTPFNTVPSEELIRKQDNKKGTTEMTKSKSCNNCVKKNSCKRQVRRMASDEELEHKVCLKHQFEELEIYANGIVHCSVCTNVRSRKRIEELVNQKNPTGISSHWQISKSKIFSGGILNPCPCEKYPETHKHYLMEC